MCLIGLGAFHTEFKNFFPKMKNQEAQFYASLKLNCFAEILDEENFKIYLIYSIHLKIMINTYASRTVHLAVR